MDNQIYHRLGSVIFTQLLRKRQPRISKLIKASIPMTSNV